MRVMSNPGICRVCPACLPAISLPSCLQGKLGLFGCYKRCAITVGAFSCGYLWNEVLISRKALPDLFRVCVCCWWVATAPRCSEHLSRTCLRAAAHCSRALRAVHSHLHSCGVLAGARCLLCSRVRHRIAGLGVLFPASSLLLETEMWLWKFICLFLKSICDIKKEAKKLCSCNLFSGVSVIQEHEIIFNV